MTITSKNSAFALFLKCLVQAFQYLGYTADLQSSTLMKKAKEKVPHYILLKWTEHTVTSIETTATLVEFQKWLEIQAHLYDKINRENFQQNILRRNNFNSSGNLNNSDSHARNLSIQSWGFPAQPTNRSQSTTISSSGTVKPTSAPPFPPLNNANQQKRFCEKCRWNHILATCPDYKNAAQASDFTLYATAIFARTVWAINTRNKTAHQQNSAKYAADTTTQHCMNLVKLSSVRQLLLPPAIPQVQMLPTKKISLSNSNVNQEVTTTQASHPNHKRAATDSLLKTKIRINFSALIWTMPTKILAWIIHSLHQKNRSNNFNLSQYLF